MATDVECEGIGCPALLRLTPLQSYDLELRDVAFPDGLGGSNERLCIGESEVPATQPPVSMALRISNWSIGTQRVTMANFQSQRLGRLNIDVSYWGQWKIDNVPGQV